MSKKSEYKAVVRVMGKLYSATGKTIEEALAGLKPVNCKGCSILTLEKGDAIRERVLMPVVTSRLFNSAGMTREIALKNASLLFQGL